MRSNAFPVADSKIVEFHSPRKVTYNPRKTKLNRGDNNRIQKLLSSEYRELSDTILVESPFAETSRNGRGVRQVALGLTSSSLIVAADVFKDNSNFTCPPGLDPSIESFELVSIYPLEYITISVFRRRCRKTLKARLIDGRTNYYELGGMRYRSLSWKIWCEEVQKLMAKKIDGSSLPESSAASSLSTSTVYFLSSDIDVETYFDREGKKTICRIWARYGGAGDCGLPAWPHKDLYLGSSYNELVNGHYTPVPIRFAGASLEELKYELSGPSTNSIVMKKSCRSWPDCCQIRDQRRSQRNDGLCDVLFVREYDRRYCNTRRICKNGVCSPCTCEKSGECIIEDSSSNVKEGRASMPKVPSKEYLEKKIWIPGRKGTRTGTLATKISRFGFGVPEKCSSKLVLGPCRGDHDYKVITTSPYALLDPLALIESGVTIWESATRDRFGSSKKQRHFRRYGISTATHFLHAVGPWSVQPGERVSVQSRRSLSAVHIRRQPIDSELKLPVSRRQLATSISCSALEPGKSATIGATARKRIVLFWTPEYWYRPRAAIVAYRQLRQHLTSIKDFQQNKDRQSNRKLFCRRKRSLQDEIMQENVKMEERSHNILKRIFSGAGSSKKRKKEQDENKKNSGTVQLKRLLKINLKISAWDLDSTTLAKQLTLIDRDLFVRIPTVEIEVLVFQRSSRNAPNFGAWIAFSHRMSCLTTSEILAIKKLDMRARIIARFINVADKCFAMGNFQSCRSILAGLQSPPIYRLTNSWARLRTHHATRYAIMERLCKIYRNPRTLLYRKTWANAQRNPPCIPYAGDLVIRLLGLKDTKNYQRRSLPNTKYLTSKKSPTKFKLLYEKPRIVTTSVNKSTQSTLYQKNFPNSIKACNQNSSVPTRNLGRHIFMTALAKLRCKKSQDKLNDDKVDLLESPGHQELARKFFNRWVTIVLRVKIKAQSEQRLKQMNEKERLLLDVVPWLANCQQYAQKYDFPGHSFAWEFLLKARYREDRENFFISLTLEPPQIT